MNCASSVDTASDAQSGGRRFRLIGIAVVVALASLTLYLVGRSTGDPLVRFIGLMVGASTFVPLPADTFVLAVSDDLPAVVVGVVGGLINATMVLVERVWIVALVDTPAFDRMRKFFDTNRLVALTERNMFLALVVGGASFIPFEPFRLIAVMRNYSVIKYFIASFLARGGRYFVLASIGSALLQIGLLQQAIWLTLALFVLGLWRSAVRLIRGTRGIDDDDEPPTDEPPAEEAGPSDG